MSIFELDLGGLKVALRCDGGPRGDGDPTRDGNPPGMEDPTGAGSTAGAGPEYLIRARTVTLLHPFGEGTRFYRHGWQSWSLASWVDLATSPIPIEPPERRAQGDDPVYALSPRHGGSGVGAVAGPPAAGPAGPAGSADGGDTILLLGALGPGARVEADARSLHGFYETETEAGDGANPASAEAEAGSREWLLAAGPEHKVFARYAGLLGERLGRRGTRPAREGSGVAPRVWCSWYGFYRDITEGLLAEVLEGLKGLPFDVFQVDDGWQVDLGEWEPNRAFPSGMAALARRIADAGFTPGLWLAPFIVRRSSRLAAERPEWLLRDETGQAVPAGHNWGDDLHALDTTNPEVEAWLDDLVRKVRAWGYGYLKLDFLYAGALPGVRHRKGLGREEAYRRAMGLIREVAGDAYVLACGAPVLASVGLVDGLRVGPDVAPFWDNVERSLYLHDPTGPGARNAIRTSLHRLWLGSLFHTDPDVVYFRTRYNLLGREERALLRDLAEVAGFKATSDPPAWLDSEEREALREWLEVSPPVAREGRYRFRVGDRVADFGRVVRG